MNIIFFGTPEFSVPFLKALITEGRAPGLVVSQPDRPAGRKALIQLTPVKRAVLDLGLATAQPENVNDSRFIEELKSLHADLFVVVAFGQILSRALLDIPASARSMFIRRSFPNTAVQRRFKKPSCTATPKPA